MAVSKRLRYEVLRRDNHACRYCGATAPDVKLTVDHVVPVALGGSDDPSNLVTACAGCNSGKSASVPDAPIVANVAEDALRWSKAMAAAAERTLADRDARVERLDEFLAQWNDWGIGDARTPVLLPVGWRDSVDQFLAAGLPMPVLLDAVDTAMGRTKIKPADKFRYMCGIAWSKITEIQKAAKAIANGATPDSAVQDPDTEARYRFALELLEGLGDSTRDHYLEWTSDYEDEDGEPYTVEDKTIAAVELAMNDMHTDLYAIERDAVDLLRLLPDGTGQRAMQKARARLYDQRGADFRGARFVHIAILLAERELRARRASAHLEQFTPEQRAEWMTYARNLESDSNLDEEQLLIGAARVSQVLEDPKVGYPGMCGGPGQHIDRCPNRAAYTIWFGDRKCCGTSPTCGGHLACELHLERMVDGEFGDRVLTDFAPITKKEA